MVSPSGLPWLMGTLKRRRLPQNRAKRKYRGLAAPKGLTTFQVTVKETDLLVSAPGDLSVQARTSILTLRRYIEDRIACDPVFLNSLEPLPPDSVKDPLAPAVIREMLAASRAAGTGPMAAVAGAIAHWTGVDLLKTMDPSIGEIIVENGGDLFLAAKRDLTVAVYAGGSPLSNKIGLKIPAKLQPVGLSTSSGTVGHSLSLGKADAATVLAVDPSLSDALATALGNMVRTKTDIKAALEWLARRPGALGGLVIMGAELGVWGEMELVQL